MSSNSEAMKRWRVENPDYMHNWYMGNRETLLARSKQWHVENKDRADYLNKRNYSLNGDSIRAKVKEWADNNPEKVEAHSIVKVKLRNGEVVRGEFCSKCGNGGVIQAHHEDYLKPLKITWLCRTCHKQEHRKVLV